MRTMRIHDVHVPKSHDHNIIMITFLVTEQLIIFVGSATFYHCYNFIVLTLEIYVHQHQHRQLPSACWDLRTCPRYTHFVYILLRNEQQRSRCILWTHQVVKVFNFFYGTALSTFPKQTSCSWMEYLSSIVCYKDQKCSTGIILTHLYLKILLMKSMLIYFFINYNMQYFMKYVTKSFIYKINEQQPSRLCFNMACMFEIAKAFQ